MRRPAFVLLRKCSTPHLAALFLAATAALIASTLLLSEIDRTDARTAAPARSDAPLGAKAEEPESPTDPPARPTGLSVATEPGSLEVSLDWDDVDGASQYLVRWREAGAANELNAGYSTAISRVDFSVGDYGQWVARVQACNDAGCGKPLTRKFTVNPAPSRSPSTTTPVESKPAPDSESTPPPALDVSISASPAQPEVNQAASLSPVIRNLPFDSGVASYSWQIQQGDEWDSVWTGSTFSYSSNSPKSIVFRLTVAYESGISDTSEPLTVTWIGDPPPVAEDPLPEPLIHTIEVATSDCELAPPEDVSVLGVARAAVAFWQAPTDEDACEPVGYLFEARSVDGGAWRAEFAPPEARSHVLDGLAPGLVEYHVTTIYPRGGSDRPRALPQLNVPEACNITLTVEANVDRGISGTWANVTGMPNGCVYGPEIEYEFKESTWDYFRNYGRFNNHGQSNPTQDSFIAYDLKPGVTYDFRIVAVDAAGRKNPSNVASAKVVYDVDGADEHSPRDVRVGVHNRGDAYVEWSEPASTAPGRTLSGFIVEWKTASGAAMTAEVGSASTVHHITGLTHGSVYSVRVAARTTAAGDVQDAWSSPSPPFTAVSEPIQVWFASNTPLIIASTGILFVYVDRNTPAGLIVCRINDDGTVKEINCPKNTLATKDVTGNVSVLARNSEEDSEVRTDSSTHNGEFGGPRAVPAYASGGNGRLVIAWGAVDSGPGHAGIGNMDAWIVSRRQQNADGTWPNWGFGHEHTITDTTARSHTFTGLANGTWQVQVRARTDGDDGDANTTDTPRLGFTSEVRTVTLAGGGPRPPRRRGGAAPPPPPPRPRRKKKKNPPGGPGGG
ncbi:MAG: fibronectin type III domain-containing protein, partial [Chloroflexota bacterium]|nr:fibronectin type III domain-containing protein [Chloroflexota bacterium]